MAPTADASPLTTEPADSPKTTPSGAPSGTVNPPPTLLRIDGVFNFRDLAAPAETRASHSGPANRPALRPRSIYRSDGLHRSPIEDRPAVASLGIRHVIDLRTDDERAAEGHFEFEGITTHHVPIVERLADLLTGSTERSSDLLLDHYRLMLDGHGPALQRAIAIIADAVVRREPVVFHCTAGKDRTGVLAAILQSSLGTSSAAVAADYAISARAMPHMVSWYRRNGSGSPGDRMREMGVDPGLAADLMAATPETMTALLVEIESTDGSVGRYLDRIGASGAVAAIRTAMQLG